MSSKRYNQVLFLMTLSVYMGLVLAGGASPALAQAAMAKAAMAKGFDLNTELEARDDLDKKPKDEKSSDFVERAREESSPVFAEFTADLYSGAIDIEKALAKIGRGNLNFSAFDFDLSLSGYQPKVLTERSITHDHLNKDAVHYEPVFENEQSITVTNLPRAGLDDLLAAK